ncbi:MAG: TonB family protein [Flavobacteriia bacterium]|nr:TonB family protein [Flavobacteriia bacterium]
MNKLLLGILMNLLVGINFAQAAELEPVMVSSEECVEFPTGYVGLIKFMQKEVNYPKDCQDQGVSGKVVVRFKVDRKGNVSKAVVVKSVHPALDQEALRVVNLTHWNWNSSCQDSATYVALPINFALNDETPTEIKEKPDTTTEFSASNFEPTEAEDEPKTNAHWNSMDLGFGLVTMSDKSLYPYWNAREMNVSTFSWNFMEYKIPILKQYLGLTTGLGFGITTLNLKNYNLVHPQDSIYGVLDTTQTYRRNGLSFFSLSAPLLFEICSKQETKNCFYLDLGVVGYWNLAGSWATSGKLPNGDRFNHTVNSRFEMSTFGAYATVRMGFDHYGLFANYNLSPLFKKNATAAVYPITFGLQYNFDY